MIVDLLDDSTDEDEANQPTIQRPNTNTTTTTTIATTTTNDSTTTTTPKSSIAVIARPITSSSSSWLRDVVSNGYIDARPSVGIGTKALGSLVTTETTRSTATTTPSRKTDAEDDDDEVLWIPTPIAMAATAKKNSATKRSTPSPSASLSVQKQPPPVNVYDITSDGDDDAEVLVVDYSQAARRPQSFKQPSAAIASSKKRPSKETPKSSATTSRAQTKAGRKPEPSARRSRSVLDSDDDDDDDDTFLLQSRPSGLTKEKPTAQGLLSQRGDNFRSPLVESWRRQFQGIASSDTTNKRKRTNASKEFEAAAASTLLSPAATTANTNANANANANANSRSIQSSQDSTNSSTTMSSKKRLLVVRNSYANTKTKLPSPSVIGDVPRAAEPSSGDRSASSPTLDLRSPLAANRHSVVAVNNPYSSNSRVVAAATNTGTELACGVCAPKLRKNTKTYPDLRPNLVLALWKFARNNLVRDSYQGRRLDRIVGRIVDLVVASPDFPVRSVGEYAIRKRGLSKRGCGGLTVIGDTLPRFEDELNSTAVMDTKYVPLRGKFFSVSEACLAAMKETIVRRWNTNPSQQQQGQQQGHSQSRITASRPQAFPADEAGQAILFSQKEYYVSLVELIPQIDLRLRPECPSRLERSGTDKGASYYLDKSTRSAEFKQIEKLLAPVEIPKADGSILATSYLKKRTVGGKQHYQLTPLGFQKAVIISRRNLPAKPGPYRFSNLQSVLPKYKGICLAVDFREGGGGDRYRKCLHEMCNKLDLQSIPYFVSTLRIGDYCFFSGDKLCPILVERKSVEDVAKSIDAGDGRWVSQKSRMYQGQYVFGYQNCRIAYIIEGKVEKHLVSNNFIGNARHKVSRERFEEEVANLEGEGFEVLRTCSVENSMFELSRWAESVARDVRSGRLPLKFTYSEFLEEVDKIPKETDFSRLAKYHAQERKRKIDEVQQASTTVDLISDGESDGEVHRGNLLPIVLDERLRKAEKRPALEDSTDARSNVVTASAPKRFKQLLDECKRIESRKRFPENGESPAALAAPASITKGKNEYSKWTAAALREKCVELGMKKSGSKAELIERVLDLTNRPPPVYRLRQQRSLYVPAKPDTASTAILVAIQIEQDRAHVGVEKYGGATKDEIYVMAEKIDIKKDPFCGGTTQTGPYHYDGWSSMRFLKESGDPPLVVEKKRRFRLSTTGDVSGLKLARAMHVWCHQKGMCKCIEQGYEFDPKKWK